MALGGRIRKTVVEIEVVAQKVALAEIHQLQRHVHTNAHKVVIQRGKGEDGQNARCGTVLAAAAVGVAEVQIGGF